uniref:PDZ domain-containing protein n=1 Tax=Gasterosteus aculeatus aculeatus TaxID=481459 RepID=A0AAQ4QLT9_GASAC
MCHEERNYQPRSPRRPLKASRAEQLPVNAKADRGSSCRHGANWRQPLGSGHFIPRRGRHRRTSRSGGGKKFFQSPHLCDSPPPPLTHPPPNPPLFFSPPPPQFGAMAKSLKKKKNHWTNRVSESVLGRSEEGEPGAPELRGGAENGQFPVIGELLPGGAAARDDLLLEVNDTPVAGLTTRDVHAVVKHSKEPVRLKYVKPDIRQPPFTDYRQPPVDYRHPPVADYRQPPTLDYRHPPLLDYRQLAADTRQFTLPDYRMPPVQVRKQNRILHQSREYEIKLMKLR